MKILLFSSAPAVSGIRTGGSIVWSQSIVRMLRKRGHEVFIVTYGEKCDLLDCREFKESLTFVSYKGKFSWIDSVMFNDIPRMVKAARMVSNIVKANNIDIVITSSIHEAGGLFSLRKLCPIIATCHGYYPYELSSWNAGKRKYPRLFVYWLLEQFAKKRVERIVCPSFWLKKQLGSRLKNKEIVVIKNMLREPPKDQQGFSRKSLGINDDVPLIISYNSLRAPFNKEAFITYVEVVKKIAAKDNRIQFLLFGAEEIESRMILESTQDTRIKILGNVKNTFELLKVADVFLHISLIDTFSLITLEAMSIGLPVIATNKGALGELIENGKTGLLTNFDPDEIATTVLSIVNNMGKTKRMGERGKGCSEKFGEDIIGKIWEEFLIANIKGTEY